MARRSARHSASTGRKSSFYPDDVLDRVIAAAGGLPEGVFYRENPDSVRRGLKMAGATEAEIDFLLHNRVELKAFASDQLVEWIEGKLEQHGVRKVIHADKVLAEGYRRQHQSAYLGQHFGKLFERSCEHIKGIEILPDLREQVARRLQERPSLSWSDAVAEIARMQTSPDSDWHCDET
jgi:hypothetical protein